MAKHKELELHSKYNRVNVLVNYLNRNMSEFSTSCGRYYEIYNALKRQLDRLYALNRLGNAKVLSAVDIIELKDSYEKVQNLIQNQREQMNRWATSNGINQEVIRKADGYFNEINEMLTRDRNVVNTLEVKDGLSLPVAVYKNSYEVSHNMQNKDPKFLEYLKLMKKSGETDEDVLERYRKSTPEKVLRDVTKKLEDNPRIYEYVAMPENAIYATNTGDINVIDEYLNAHGNELSFTQRMKLKKQKDAVNEAQKTKNMADLLMEQEEEISEKPRVFKPSGAKNPDACELDISLPSFQTSSQGCLSCGVQMLIHSRGRKEITQEQVRDYRPVRTTEEIDDNRILINEINNRDGGKIFRDLTDPILAYAPNTMVHELTIQQYNRPTENKGISPASYLDNSLEVIKKTIIHAIKIDQSPVVFRKPGHFITIIGIDGDTVKYKDSLARSGNKPNDTHTASLKQLLSNLLINNNAADRAPVEIAWVSDIKLAKDGKSIHGIPSKYTQMKEDGSIQLPPDEIMHEAETFNISGVNKNGVNIYRIAGDEDNLVNRDDDKMYTDGGIQKFEKVYLPKRLNAQYLKTMAENRTAEEEAELESADKEFWGVDRSKKVEQPVFEQKVEKTVKQIQNDAIENVVWKTLEKENPEYSLQDIINTTQILADEIDKHKISIPLLSTYASYDNLSAELQQINDLAVRGRNSAVKNDNTFSPDDLKRLIELISGAVETAYSYLESKVDDFNDDLNRKLDTSKLTREQPRIRTVIATLDKLLAMQNSLTGGKDKAIIKQENDEIIRNFKVILVNEGIDKKKQQEDSFKDRLTDADMVRERLDEIEALMGIQPEFLPAFQDKHRIRREEIDGKKVSLFNRIKPIKKPFKAIGSDNPSDILSNKDFAALSFAASTTREVYNKRDKEIIEFEGNTALNQDERYRMYGHLLARELTAVINFPLSSYIDRVVDSRSFAEKALRDYENGEKDALASLITQGIKNFCRISFNAADCYFYNELNDLMIYSEMGQRMYAMLERDPELLKLATKKGLTSQEVFQIRSIGIAGKVDKLYDYAVKAMESDRKNNINWTEEQKLEYYTDFLMGIRYKENTEAINADMKLNPDYINDMKRYRERATELSINAMKNFDKEISKILVEDNFSAEVTYYDEVEKKNVNLRFEQILSEHRANVGNKFDRFLSENNPPLSEVERGNLFDELEAEYDRFSEKVSILIKVEEEVLLPYQNKILEEMKDAIRAEARKQDIDIDLPENVNRKVPILLKVKEKQLTERRRAIEANKAHLSDDEINKFVNDFEDFNNYKKRINILQKCAKLYNDLIHSMPQAGDVANQLNTHYRLLSQGEMLTSEKYNRDNDMLKKMANPEIYEKQRRRIRAYLKGTGAINLKPYEFYRQMKTRQNAEGMAFHEKTKRTETVNAMLGKYEKLKPAEKNQLAEAFAHLADPAQQAVQNPDVNRKVNKQIQSKNMIEAFVKNAERFIKGIEGTYGKGKSDSKPSDLMQGVINALKSFDSDMHVKDFGKNLETLQDAINKYVEKRGYPGKADRVERIEYLYELRTEIHKAKQEMSAIQNGKAGMIHSVKLGNETKGNMMTEVDLKKNLVAFTFSMLKMSESGMTDMFNYDPNIPSAIRPANEPLPPEPSQKLKNVFNAMKQWHDLTLPGVDGKGQVITFEKLKEIVERVNTATTIWLSSNKLGSTDFTKNRYDYVKNVRDNAQNALRNIRLMQPYMDIETAEGRLGSLNVFDAVRNMPEPYNRIVAIADEPGSLKFTQENMAGWNASKDVLKNDANNIQRKFDKGEELRNDIVSTNFNISMSKVYRNPYSKLIRMENVNPNALESRPKNLANEATIQLFKRSMDEMDGWSDMASKYSNNEIDKAIKEISKEFAKTNVFKNVVNESTIFDVEENVLKEAKRLGKEKTINSLTSKYNLERVIKNQREAERAGNVNNINNNNNAPAL